MSTVPLQDMQRPSPTTSFLVIPSTKDQSKNVTEVAASS